MKEALAIITCFVLSVCLGIFLGATLESSERTMVINKRAIKVNAAYYDSKTGDFTWSDNTMKYVFEGGKQ